MASYTVSKSKHATLSGTTVDTVTLSGGYGWAEIMNRDLTNVLYVTGNGDTPTAGGDDTDIIPAGTGALIEISAGVMKLIGNGNAYSVSGVSD